MSIASEISRLQGAKADIKSAIEAKGVTVPSDAKIDTYDDYIAQISGGSNFDDWVKDGDTHLWIDIVDPEQCAQNLRIRMIGTIDWGDGSTKDSVSVTTYTTFSHTYSDIGRYRIDLHPTSGTFFLGGASSSYNVMGSRSTSRYYKSSVLYQVEVGSSIITSLSGYAFYYCYGLKRVYIPKNIVTIDTNLFFNCYGVSQVIFEEPSTITTANFGNIFYYCYGLQSVTPLAVTGNGTSISGTVRNCHSLVSFTIPSTVTSIAANSLANLYGIKHLYCLPTAAPSIADSTVFSNFPSSCVIHVPIGSLTSYQSAGTWSSYSSQMAEAGSIKYTLSHVSRSNKESMVAKNSSYTCTLTPDDLYTFDTVTVKMGGTDITGTAYSNGVVTIPSVTGNITITATANM